jgi:hypothetical protein
VQQLLDAGEGVARRVAVPARQDRVIQIAAGSQVSACVATQLPAVPFPSPAEGPGTKGCASYCSNAAFSEHLHVTATATNGYGTLTGYNATDDAAFALAKPCPDDA